MFSVNARPLAWGPSCLTVIWLLTGCAGDGSGEPAPEPPVEVETPARDSGAVTVSPPAGAPEPAAARTNFQLFNPASLTATAPAVFRARLVTTRGDIVIEVTRAWAPIGADRFYNMVTAGFFTDIGFFRVPSPPFVAQFGIHGDAEVSAAWSSASIRDDKVTQSNARGTLVFAQTGQPNSRTTQLFLNLRDNARLDNYGQGFPPIGRVVRGMEVADQLFSGYGEEPNQTLIEKQGNSYLRRCWPKLDYIKSASVEN